MSRDEQRRPVDPIPPPAVNGVFVSIYRHTVDMLTQTARWCIINSLFLNNYKLFVYKGIKEKIEDKRLAGTVLSIDEGASG